MDSMNIELTDAQVSTLAWAVRVQTSALRKKATSYAKRYNGGVPRSTDVMAIRDLEGIQQILDPLAKEAIHRMMGVPSDD